MSVYFILFFILIIIAVIIGIFSGCSKRDVDQEIKDRITEFYEIGEFNGYEPVAYSKFDTIINNRDRKNGSIILVTGKLTHTFYAKSNDGKVRLYLDTFNITIGKDGLAAFPPIYEERIKKLRKWDEERNPR